jgi:hypothetical protein
MCSSIRSLNMDHGPKRVILVAFERQNRTGVSAQVALRISWWNCHCNHTDNPINDVTRTMESTSRQLT